MHRSARGPHVRWCPQLVRTGSRACHRQRAVPRPVAAGNGEQPRTPQAVDVFLCHGGGKDNDATLLSHSVRRELQQIPKLGGGAVVCASRDDVGVGGNSPAEGAVQATILEAPICAR